MFKCVYFYLYRECVCTKEFSLLAQLVVRYVTTMHSWSLSELFSRTHVQQLAQEIMQLVLIDTLYLQYTHACLVCDSKVEVYIANELINV